MALSAFQRDVKPVFSTLPPLTISLHLELGRFSHVLLTLLPLVHFPCF